MARYRTISSTIPEAVDTFRPGWVSAPFSIRDAVRRGLGAEDVDDRLAAAADEHLAGFGQMPAPEVLGGLGVALGDGLEHRGHQRQRLAAAEDHQRAVELVEHGAFSCGIGVIVEPRSRLCGAADPPGPDERRPSLPQEPR